MKLLQIGASGRQEEVEVPGVGAAVGDWNSYTPDWSSLSNPQPAIGNGNISARWRRVGDSLEVLLALTVGSTTTFGTGEWYFTLPSGLTLGSTAGPLGTAMAHDSSAAQAYFGSVLAQGTNQIRVLTGLNWRSSHPMTWASGDYIFLRFTAQILEWGTNINLAQDFREYACNSSTTTTDDTTSFSNNPSGASIKPFAPAGTSFIRKRARFVNEIRDSDILILQISLTPTGNDWVTPADISWTRSYGSAGANAYGIALRRVSGAPLDVDVLFYSKPVGIPGSAWDSTNSQRWRVVKISGGNFAEAGGDDYYTTETLTGKKWIDGKPIYRKVVDFGALPNAITKSVAHGISGATAFVSVTGVAGNSGVNIQLPYNSPTGLTAGISLVANASNIDITTGVDRSAWSAKIILEYTK